MCVDKFHEATAGDHALHVGFWDQISDRKVGITLKGVNMGVNNWMRNFINPYFIHRIRPCLHPLSGMLTGLFSR